MSQSKKFFLQHPLIRFIAKIGFFPALNIDILKSLEKGDYKWLDLIISALMYQ